MSRASDERDAAVETMMSGVLFNAFSKVEVEAMLMEAFKRMTVTELEELVKTHTRYDDLMDVEVAVM
jgi:hypothetical protein